MLSFRRLVNIIGGLLLSVKICSASVLPEADFACRTKLDSLSVRVFFHRGKSFIDPELSGNRENIGRFFSSLDSLSLVQGIAIDSVVRVRPSASPEGKTVENEALCLSRADVAVALFKERGLPGFSFEILSSGEDWRSLSSLLKESGMKGSGEAVRIIEGTPDYVVRKGKIVGGRKMAAMNLWGGRFWWQMDSLFFPLLRQVTLTVAYSDLNGGNCVSSGENAEETAAWLAEVKSPLHQMPLASSGKTALMASGKPSVNPSVNPSENPSGTPPRPAQSSLTPSSLDPKARPFRRHPALDPGPGRPVLALKTNLLYDAASLVNLGLEVPVGKRFSIAADAVFPWWRNRGADVTIQMLGGMLEGRYWFGKRDKKEAMTGFFAGVQAGAGYFDFQLGNWTGGNGVQGDFYLLGGVSAGFAHEIRPGLRFEYSLGVGYLRCDFQEYFSADGTKYGDIKAIPYPWQVKRLSGFLPTKASVSLVWMIQSKKGGGR